PERIVGTCIDIFHKNPGHQRTLLADPSRLPYRTEITVGDLKIQLLVNGSFDANGHYVGNVLEWMDVTASRLNEGMLAAINRAQAVIEFSLDGRIQHANENFLKTLGYTMEEIRGQHHAMFVPPKERDSDGYREFWAKLGRGEFDAGQYQRIAKNGEIVWIQATSAAQRRRQGYRRRQDRNRHHRRQGSRARQRDGMARADRGAEPVASHDRVQSRWHDHHRQRQFSRRARL
ncbi:MAG: PAS domain-containing protein, partial [Pseudolabrys sp.]|nr:PAS domain-containing protein [Pseudolabrys sp.]